MKKVVLEKLGLTKSEAKVYEILLANEPLAASEVAKKSGLTRTNAYSVLNKLEEKHLIEETKKKKKLTYRVEHPVKLLEYAEDKEREFASYSKVVEGMLPEMISDYNLVNNKPGISHYEGMRGIKKFYGDILRTKPKELLIFRSIEQKKKVDDFLMIEAKKRAAADIQTRVISPLPITKTQRLKDTLYFKNRIYIPSNVFGINTQIYIYKNKVSFITFKGTIHGTLIEDPHLSAALKIIFNLIWDGNQGEKEA